MKKTATAALWATLLALVFVAGACRGKATDAAPPHEAEHEHENGTTITLAPEALANAGIRTAQAAAHVFRRRVAAPGVLEFNSRRLAHLTARTQGRIERVLAVAGDRVAAGQVLAEAYSPDFMSLQAEFLQAAERAQRPAADPSDASAARAMMESARQRLLIIGASGADVNGIGSSRIARPLLPIRAPFSGTIIEAGVVPGDHVELGASLFRLADPSVLWANLHIREGDMAALRPGAGAELRTQAYPGEMFPGRLLLIGDVLDEKLRTVPGRVEVANSAGKLKAGMFVEAVLESAGSAPALAVPEAAVQDDDGRQIVFVQAAAGKFVRREIKTGQRSAGQVEVRQGLAAGETVVTSGSFLLKSEMRKDTMEDEHGHS